MPAWRCALLIVSRWCLHGVQVVPRWHLAGGVSTVSMLIPGVRGVLVVSWWRRVGGVEAVVLVVGWLCPGGVSLRAPQILRASFRGRHTIHQVLFSCCGGGGAAAATDDDDGDDDDHENG